MLGILIIILAVLAAVVVLAVGLLYLGQEREREREAHQRAVQAQGKNLRDAFLLELRKKGPGKAHFYALAEAMQVPHEVARRAAEEFYGQFCSRFLEDGKVTEAERRQLDTLRRVLELPDSITESIESRTRDERYRREVKVVLADGKVSEEEAAELAQLRADLGLSRQDALTASRESSRDGYLALFREIACDGRITPEELEELRRCRVGLGLSADEANAIIRADALKLYRRWFCNIMQDGQVTEEEERALAWLRDEFHLQPTDVRRYESELEELKRLAAYREGNLPSVRTGKLLEGGEICHWDGRCTFEWRTATQRKEAFGDLVITSERLVFSSATRSFHLAPSKILDVRLFGDGLEIATSVSRGAGAYLVERPREVEAILVGVVRRHKYQLSANYSSSRSRHIPDAVRRQVWQRDGGRCVRCQADDYLEFDHIIPFSRGGANTVANVQVLCRRCNSLKRDRI